MAVDPLEGLTKVAANYQLDFSFMEEPRVQEPDGASSPASVHLHRREPRKWGQSKCGSRTNPASCWSVVQSRTLRGQRSPQNAERERNRVHNLRQAFHSLQAVLPSVPPETKLSKMDVLILATNYIAYLTETLNQGGTETTLSCRSDGYLRPVKKWPMRSLLYCGSIGERLTGVSANQTPPPGRDGTRPLSVVIKADKE